MDYIGHYKKDAAEFDYFEERSGATEDDERRAREFILSKVRRNTYKIMDAGCGSAWAAKALIPEGKFIVSTDISQINVQKALQKTPSEKHCGVVCDSYSLPFKNSSFDCIIASEIIEHTVNPGIFVQCLAEAVKPDGKLIISTPYKEKIAYSLCIHCNQKTPHNAHIHSFDENMLTDFGINAKTKHSRYSLFGNKYLIFGRTYVILKFFPFSLWKLIDAFFNKTLGKPAHILIEYFK